VIKAWPSFPDGRNRRRNPAGADNGVSTLDTYLLYFGCAFIFIWLAGLVGLWKGLRGRSGPPAISSTALIEALMLTNIASLILGVAFILKAGPWFD
jgi:hypothetical protein